MKLKKAGKESRKWVDEYYRVIKLLLMLAAILVSVLIAVLLR